MSLDPVDVVRAALIAESSSWSSSTEFDDAGNAEIVYQLDPDEAASKVVAELRRTGHLPA
ncbi:hypothetical protein AB0K18_43200 [Nonomuraea sp. NPDC049421]|uniref:hypothetical protein n=1 Tax=Nonomuraea sp. NPDC049421 TaxID=3155275 RepID=UPI00341D0B6B